MLGSSQFTGHSSDYLEQQYSIIFREHLSSLKNQTFFVDKIEQKLGLLLILKDSGWKGSWKVWT